MPTLKRERSLSLSRTLSRRKSRTPSDQPPPPPPLPPKVPSLAIRQATGDEPPSNDPITPSSPPPPSSFRSPRSPTSEALFTSSPSSNVGSPPRPPRLPRLDTQSAAANVASAGQPAVPAKTTRDRSGTKSTIDSNLSFKSLPATPPMDEFGAGSSFGGGSGGRAVSIIGSDMDHHVVPPTRFIVAGSDPSSPPERLQSWTYKKRQARKPSAPVIPQSVRDQLHLGGPEKPLSRSGSASKSERGDSALESGPTAGQRQRPQPSPPSPPLMERAQNYIPHILFGCFCVLYMLGVWRCIKIAFVCSLPWAGRWLLPQPAPPPRDKYPPSAAYSSPVGWVNYALRALFPVISTDVLAPFIDLLEDALIEQVPPIVTSVRLTSLSLGSEPLLLTDMRPITDEQWFHALAHGQHTIKMEEQAKAHKPGFLSRSASGTDSNSPSTPNTQRRSSMAAPSSQRRQSAAAAQRRNSMAASAVRTPTVRKHTRDISNVTDTSALSGAEEIDIIEEEAKIRRRDRILQRIRGRRRGREAGAGHLPISANDLAEADALDMGELAEDQGQYVNYEVSFTYRRTPEMNKRGLGLHMVAYFGWGVRGLGGSEIPVYIDLVELRGKVRVRLLLSPSPPFVRRATFSFMKMPEFDISARPLRNIGFGSINAMDLPLIKSYVQKSILAVAGQFVRPQSYSLDVDRLLLGHDTALRTNAIGVLRVIIHGARNLPRADTMGSCDPYVALSFSKFNKPLFSTRTIVDTQDPIWEEPAFILVDSDAVTAGEKLRLRVCDSDRFSADDAVGVVEVDLAELVDQSTKAREAGDKDSLFSRRDELESDKPGMRTQGHLEWSIRFFPLWQMPEGELQHRLDKIKDKRGEGQTVAPWWLEWLEQWMERPEWEIKREERRKEMVEYFTGERYRDEIEAAEKPSGAHPSGVLQFHIHQCHDLELESLSGTFSPGGLSSRKSAASGKPALSDIIDRAPSENPDQPSAYCEVHLNDKYVYRTRTKQVNPMPYFNAVSERFIRDWRMAKIVFVIKDERDREHNPILGVVSLRLKDVFQETCHITRWFPIVGGIGWGRIRISLLFRPIDISLPPGISSYETATFDLTGLSTDDLAPLCGRDPTIVIETEHDRAVLLAPDEDSASAFARSRESLVSGESAPYTPGSVRSKRHSSSASAIKSPNLSASPNMAMSPSMSMSPNMAKSPHLSASPNMAKSPSMPMGTMVPSPGMVSSPGMVTSPSMPGLGFGETPAHPLRTRLSSQSMASSAQGPTGNGIGTGGMVSWGITTPIRLAIQYRSSCSILFSVVTRRRIGKSKVHALATLRLDDCPEGEECQRRIPLFETASVRDGIRAASSYYDYTMHEGDNDVARTPHGVRLLGFINVSFVLHPGVSRVHRRLGKRDLRFKAVYDAWLIARQFDTVVPPATENDEERQYMCDDDDLSDEDDSSPVANGANGANGASSSASVIRRARKGSTAANALHQDDTQAMLDQSRSHSKALHDSNRGIFQLKLARTGKYVKDKLEAKVLASAQGTNLAQRPRGADMEVEREGQSRLG